MPQQKNLHFIPTVFLYLLCTLSLFGEEESYPRAPASVQQEGVPTGTLLKSSFKDSKIFNGTHRNYWVYVPAQYKEGEKACLMVFQDGGSFVLRPGTAGHIPTIFDNLIHTGDMPVTIGLFINPGVVPAISEGAMRRFNRSLEYDGMGPDYANFLVEEMLPLLSEKHQLTISDDPNDRAICGTSSGGIAAFTVAWERPDQFRRVYSMIGTFVGLRGGNDYPTLIRKSEPKPLRVFLQDGENDLNVYSGDWWMANQTMQRALEFSGYENNFGWGKGKHNRKHGDSIMPEVLRWLWKDHATTRVTTHPDKAKSLANKWLIPGEGWKVVSEGHHQAEGLALSADGTLYFTDVCDSELYKITPDGKQQLLASDTGEASGIALGPDGKTLYTTSSAAKEIRAYNTKDGSYTVLAEGTASNDIVISHSGQLFYTDLEEGNIWYIDLSTKQRELVGEIEGLKGIGLSADQKQLNVCDFDGPFIHAFSITPEGRLTNQQAFFHAHAPTNSLNHALDGQCSAASEHLLVSTRAGVQIFNRYGVPQVILPRPSHEDGRIRNCALFKNTLYISTGERIYQRKVKLTAAPAWQSPPARVELRH